jgi:hypothetical protein
VVLRPKRSLLLARFQRRYRLPPKAKDIILNLRAQRRNRLPQIGDKVRHTEDSRLNSGEIIDIYTNWQDGVTYYVVEFSEDGEEVITDCLLNEIEIL